MDAGNTSGPEPARAADREAVRRAEQTLGDAWIGLLLLAESETKIVVGACERARERAADRLRAAQRAADLTALARAQQVLELTDAACDRAVRTHQRARARLTRELPMWSEATARRLRQALSDRPDIRRR